MPDRLVANVSDTARWMAAYRALESARPDALFDDPYAEQLAGERGRAIAATAPRLTRSGWWWITRTKLIDELVIDGVHNGCDRVLNLAAGFDTRPYRLQLPGDVEWIEADLPALIDEKKQLLADAQARCRLSRIAVDLADAPSRAAFLADATGGARHAIVITEGLLLYLDEQQVGALADDLHRAGVGEWITDLIAPVIVRRMMRQMSGLDNAPMVFEPKNGVAFFEERGWSTDSIKSIMKYAQRQQRLPTVLRSVAWLAHANPRNLGHAPWSAVVRFKRDTSDS